MDERTPGAAGPGPEEILGAAVESALDRYRAGLCNIGPRGRLLRLTLGLAAGALAAALYVELKRRDLAPLWRLTVGLPALVAAVGLEQARTHFCVANATLGVYNLDEGTRRVEEAAARHADRAYAASILARCTMIAALIALASFLF